MTEAPARPPAHYRTSWTIEELLALPENGMRQELIAGRRVESPNPPNPHQWAAKQLMFILDDAVPREYEAVHATDVRIGPDLLVPDVLVATSEELCAPDGRYLEPKDILLVAEILDSGDAGFERAWKPQRYADGGIPYYMELELSRLPRVRVYELRGRGYAEVADAHAGETLKLPEPFALSFDPARLVGGRRGVDRERTGS
ncbi:hypothetical protein GCM10029978_034160 [Actinoallomurus acanthiterrae]